MPDKPKGSRTCLYTTEQLDAIVGDMARQAAGLLTGRTRIAIVGVRVAWVDQKRDLAQLVVMSSDDAFANWSPRGPIPLAGSEVRGVLLLPGQSGDPVMAPSRGILYGANDGWLWMSMVVGPGSSGSCVMDDQNRVFAILTATSRWGSPESGSRPSLSTPLQPKD